MNHSKVVSRDEWLAARKQHLKKEKEFTRLRDKLSAERRAKRSRAHGLVLQVGIVVR
jgi:predicted dithiol-disulfide oxidoreductase (DUF899 family)